MAIGQDISLLAPFSRANHEGLYRKDAEFGLHYGAVAVSAVSLMEPLYATPDKLDPRHATCVKYRANRILDRVTRRARRKARIGLLRAARVGSIAYLFSIHWAKPVAHTNT